MSGSSSSARNPKDLHDIVKSARSNIMDDDNSDNNCIDKSVMKLRNISSEEKTELGMLKCRIMDQSRLIMMLKMRNDEYIISNMTLDKVNNELQSKLDILEQQLTSEQSLEDQNKQLKQTIEQLKIQHFYVEQKSQEYKQIIDQLKSNEKYQQEQLQLELSNEQKKSNHLNQKLQQNVEDIERLKMLHEKEINNNQTYYMKKIDENNNERLKLEEKLADLLSELKIKNDQLKTIQKQNNLDYEHVTKTNQQLLNQNKTLEQKIKDVTNGYDRQTERIHELEVNLKKSDERFKVEEEKVNVNVRVKQLEEKLSNANEKLSNLYQEFNAYKLFSNTLLDKERQLNERLQNLFGGASVNRTTKTTEH